MSASLRIALIVTTLASLVGTVGADEFTRLFDGKSFKGWEGNLKAFRIEDGAIVGGQLDKPVPRNEFLCTKTEYGNFELKLKVKTVGEQANGGIQFRSKRVPNHHEVSGYQADVGAGWWGKLYDESRRNKVLAGEDNQDIVKDGEWNEYVIRCQGSHIQLFVNGRKTVDYTENDSDIPKQGVVGVQIHGGPPSEAWYKDIEIRELKP
jgi:hypothetical protein